MNERARSALLASTSLASRAAGRLLRAVWALFRLPLLAILVILEPLVRVLLGAFALLLVLAALFFELATPRASIPVWGMLTTAVGCVTLLALYYAILRLLSA
jgi:hypothetical protein